MVSDDPVIGGTASLRRLEENESQYQGIVHPPSQYKKNGTGFLVAPPDADSQPIEKTKRLDSMIHLIQDSTQPLGIAPTAYDTAWLACTPAYGDNHSSEFPQSLEWLIANQHPDGSWGGSVRYFHDRILTTLAALVPLAKFGRSEAALQSVVRGTRFLWQHGHLLASEPTELVAFELLLPAMVRRAQNAGVPVPPHLDIYETQRAEKMRLIPAGALYSPRVTIVHSLEFLGEQADLAGLHAAQGINGAIGNSPAATALFYGLSHDEKALDYLNRCLKKHGGAQVPVLHPSETYELLWAAYHLFLAGVPASELLTDEQRVLLDQEIKNGGVSLSTTFPIPDADDTAVALLFLHDLGEQPDPRVLQAFSSPDGHFASFQYERHTSVGVSLHALHALLRIPGYPDRTRTIVRVLDYLASEQVEGLYWLDKWHISPYYATAHALCVLKELPPQQAARMKPLVDRSREWIRYTQNSDGSWGFYGQSTVEETAYGLLAMAAGAGASQTPFDRDCCDAAARYLLKHAGNPEDEFDLDVYPPLWIDKCLYTPKVVVKAVVESALEAYRRMYGAVRTDELE